MQILLPDTIAQQLIIALQRAGPREIGGILMGEHIAENSYRIRSITIQRQAGTPFAFQRLVGEIKNSLNRFFGATNYHYTRFNYLGEWHSHPSFSLEPSNVDRETMWGLVQDPQVGANFAVLVIVHLENNEELLGAVSVFLPNWQRFQGTLIREGNQT